jgi:hypothetical protein
LAYKSFQFSFNKRESDKTLNSGLTGHVTAALTIFQQIKKAAVCNKANHGLIIFPHPMLIAKDPFQP